MENFDLSKVLEEEDIEALRKEESKTQKTKKEKEIKSQIQSSANFDDVILSSALDSTAITDPNVSNKHIQFLEILLGRQVRDSPANQKLNAIKRKIIAEYRSQKLGAPGVMTQG